MTHAFKIGQTVFYHPKDPLKRDGQYIVIAALPQPNGEVRYLIRSLDNASLVEYTADANELR